MFNIVEYSIRIFEVVSPRYIRWSKTRPLYSCYTIVLLDLFNQNYIMNNGLFFEVI